MTSPFDDVKKGESYSGETISWAYILLACILCDVFCILCWTFFGIFSIMDMYLMFVLWTCDVCIVDMCLYFYILYEHVLSFMA